MTAGRKVSSSLSQDWCTPPKYVTPIREFFGGTVALDPCSNHHSILGAEAEYCLPITDGLLESWDYATIFVNPPYGRDVQRGTTIRDWLKRCAEAHYVHGAEVLALVPVATNTLHWKNYVFGAATAITFLYDTRLKFLIRGKDDGKGAPMSCAMIYWGSRYERFADIFSPFGAVVDIRRLNKRQSAGERQLGQSALHQLLAPTRR